MKHQAHQLSLTFLGAAETVTGSKFLVDHDGSQFLLDCGLFQGLKKLRLQNWKPLPIDLNQLKGIVLTHAHLDHSGYIPRLVNDGYRGPIYCTHATRDLCKILLPDSGYLQEEDAEYANRKTFSKHHPALPLYTERDATRSLRFFESIDFQVPFKIDKFEIQFLPAGHILGAASALVSIDGQRIVFSGDVGRPHDLLMNAPTKCPKADWIVMESTYGNRHHDSLDILDSLTDVLKPILDKQGVVLIPSFAVGRTQTVLFAIHQLLKTHHIPLVPVYVNSPMATNVTELYRGYSELHKLSKEACEEAFGSAHFVRTVEESKALNRKQGPMIIISSSGMLSGGRVLHHLGHFGQNANNLILLVGYQAMGTRGAALLNGARQIKIHGNYIPIRASVKNLDFLSAHSDQDELLDWLNGEKNTAKQVFLVHGDPSASDALRLRIQDELHLSVKIPEMGEKINLT